MRRYAALLALLAAIVASGLLPAAASAANCASGTTTWTGMGGDDDFNNALNWSNGAPGGSCTASIAGASVTLKGGASPVALNLTGGASLNITGFTDANGGAQQSSLNTTTTSVATGSAIHLTSTNADLSQGAHAINPGGAVLSGMVTNSGSISTDVGTAGPSSDRIINANVTNNAGASITMHTDMNTCACGVGGTWINNGTLTTDPGTTSTFTRTGQGVSFTQPAPVAPATATGTFANHGHALIAGSFVNTAGTTTGNPIQIGGSLDASSSAPASFEFDNIPGVIGGGSLTNDIGAGATVLVHNSGMGQALGVTLTQDVTNHGTLTMDGAAGTGEDQLLGSHTLTNAGTLDLSQTGTSQIQAPVTNTGTMTLAAGTTTYTYRNVITQQAGSFNIGMGATFDANHLFVLSGGTLSNLGALNGGDFTHTGGNATGNRIVLCGGTLTAPGPGTASFDFFGNAGCNGGGIADGTTIGSGDNVRFRAFDSVDDFSFGSFTNNGTVTVVSDAAHVVQLHGQTLTNNGTYRLTGSNIAMGLVNNGTTTIVAAPGLNTSFDSRYGPITQAGGTLDVAGSLSAGATQTGGVTSIEGNWTLSSALQLTGGTLLGSGTLTGDLISDAIVSPGSVDSDGTLTVTGNYTQHSAGTLALRANGSGHDELHVGGSATLDGTLALTTAGPSPTPDQTFIVLTDAAQSGQFATTTGQGYTPQYDATDVKLLPAELTASPTTLTFGSTAAPVVLGTTSSAQPTTLMNNGQTPVSVGTITVGGPDAGTFALSQDGCSNQTLAPGHGCTVAVRFTPSVDGPATATLIVADNAAGSPQQVSLEGVGGHPVAQLSPGSLSFSAAPGETAQAQSVTLTNTGSSVLHVSDATVGGTDASAFHIDSQDCHGAALAPAATCRVLISFAPSTPGSYAASLSVSDDAGGSPQSVALAASSTAIATGPGNLVTGRVLDASRPGDPPVANAGVSACHGTGSAMSCRDVSTGADGRYSIPVPAGSATLTVYPPTPRLLSDTATVAVSASQQTIRDFTLTAPTGLSSGVSFETSRGATDSGLPFITTQQPFTINVPVQASRTGPAGQTIVHVELIGIAGNTHSDYGNGATVAQLVYFGVHYDSHGILDRLSRPAKGAIDCGHAADPQSPCAQLAAFSGVENGAGFGVASGSRALARAAAVGGAAKDDCPSGNPQHKVDIATNNYGGVTITINNPFGDGTPPLTLTAPQIAIPSIPENGNLAHDLGWGAVTGIANFGLNLIPGVAEYNTIVGLGNAGVTLADDTNNDDLKALTRGGLVLSVLAQVGANVHGPVGWFAKGLTMVSSVGSSLIGSKTAEGSILDFPAKSNCPTKHGDAYVDPSGIVRTTRGVPVAGATVRLATARSARGKTTPLPNGSVVMSPANRRNPDHTTATGDFGWDTLPGLYSVSAAKAGCRSTRGSVTRIFQVPPPRSNLVLTLSCPKLRLRATRTRLRVLRTRLGVELVASVGARRGRAGRAQLVGTVTFKSGRRTLGTLPLAADGYAAAFVGGRHVPRRFTASFGGNGVLAPSGGGAR